MWRNLQSALRALTGKSAESGGTKTLSETPIGTLLEDFADAAVVYDPNFTVLSVNKAAEALFGLTRQELVGMHVDPGWVDKPRYRTFSQVLFPSLAPASAERSEAGTWPQIVSLTFENPHREFEVRTTRVTNTEGNSASFVKIIRDETRTHEVFAARSEFVGIAAHQLRTPLTALRWSLESVTGGAPGKDGGLLKESIALVDRCLKIVNDFLDAAKIEEGKFGFSFEETDAVKFIETLVGMAAPVAAQYGVGLSFDHGGLPSFLITIDSSRLSTALLNLLDNAIRYNVKGGRVVVTLAQENGRAVVTVADTGIGIPKGEERKIFQKLERGSNAIQAEPNGSGLGLYITKNIVEGHGGTIEFSSEADRGTKFTVSFPATRK